jgi:hypothetical protein
VGVRAAGAPPDPKDHLVGLVWFTGADDLQRLLAVELNPFEGYGVLALLTGNVNDVEVAALVGRLATMTLGRRFLRHCPPPATAGFEERCLWVVCRRDGSGNGGSRNEAVM